MNQLSVLTGVYLGVKFLDHRVGMRLAFLVTARVFQSSWIIIIIATSIVGRLFHLLHILTIICYCQIKNFSHLLWFYVYLMVSDVEHLFMWPLVICFIVSSSVYMSTQSQSWQQYTWESYKGVEKRWNQGLGCYLTASWWHQELWTGILLAFWVTDFIY